MLPKPLCFFPRRCDQRLPERKAVTIAAGFRCHEGIILCADSEYSYCDVSLRGRKLFLLDGRKHGVLGVVAFAGSIRYGTMLIRKMNEKFQKEQVRDFSQSDFTDFVERELILFHKAHIYKHPRFGYLDGPTIEMVIAVSLHGDARGITANGPLVLISTLETTVNLETDGGFASIGIGKSMADWIVQPFTVQSFQLLNFKKALLLATHMLYQVKSHVPGCGGMSQFILVNSNGGLNPVTDYEIPSHEEYSSTFQQILHDLFFAMADLDATDPMLLATLTISKNRALRIREEQRLEMDKRAKLAEKMKAVSSDLSTLLTFEK